ncbi:alternate F1F0 ATPase, F1 subunit gamma [compost metagenome]
MPAFPAPNPGGAQHCYLALSVLVPKLVLKVLRIVLLGALYQSLQQENRWRLAQMERAQDHLEESRRQLDRRYFRQRQAEMTTELEMLMSSLDEVQRGRSKMGVEKGLNR